VTQARWINFSEVKPFLHRLLVQALDLVFAPPLTYRNDVLRQGLNGQLHQRVRSSVVITGFDVVDTWEFLSWGKVVTIAADPESLAPGVAPVFGWSDRYDSQRRRFLLNWPRHECGSAPQGLCETRRLEGI
jgi:hypothetical protein